MSDNTYKEIAETFHGISIVEMKHLEKFAQTTKLLGLEPRFWSYLNSPKPIYWSPDYLKYPDQIHDMILYAIHHEESTIKKYTHQIKLINNHSIQDLLKRIILDEEKHVAVLTNLYNQYSK